ncbi:MAG: MBL fold metallo-hydrolase [Chthoniobacterales bacterium]
MEHGDGIFLPQIALWMDSQRTRDFAFVSHAHSDHTGSHRRAILTEGTARLMFARGKRVKADAHILDYGQTMDFENFRITLVPAGHVHGSAQGLIECEAGSLLYTGDFKLRKGASSPAAQIVHAETLVMETTFGLPRYIFPPLEEVVAQVVAFCNETLNAKEVPVLFAYSLGKAQEILAALANAGLSVLLHDSVEKITAIYRDAGVAFAPHEVFSAEKIPGRVLLFPPHFAKSAELRAIPNRRTAMLTGWALDPSAIYRMGCDRAFPLSDHADYPDLLRFVEQVNPARVLTLHGFANEFARDLRTRGIEAWSLLGANQLDLRL